VYVLSQNEGKGAYKVGMSKGDLWRRMSNYATAFVDFYVYYLVPVPYADVFAVERFMHRALPGRKAFPSETKERGNLSEWFDCSQRDLRRAFRDLAKDPKLNPIGAFRITKNKIFPSPINNLAIMRFPRHKGRRFPTCAWTWTWAFTTCGFRHV
jgi:hypothetical protein